jgi:hypothetical protein
MPNPAPRNVPSSRARFALVLAFACAGALLAGAPAEAAKGGVKGKPPKGESQGRGQGQGQGQGNDQAVDPYRADDTSSRNLERVSRWSFGRDDERTIRSWFGRHENLEGLPPGLAQRETLPPGLRRQLARNGTLPPGLEAKLHPLPDDLDGRLLRLPDGYRRVVVDRDVLLVNERTNVIQDILRNVLPALRR